MTAAATKRYQAAKIDYAKLIEAAGVAFDITDDDQEDDLDRAQPVFAAVDDANKILKAGAAAGVDLSQLLTLLMPMLLTLLQKQLEKKPDAPPAPPVKPPTPKPPVEDEDEEEPPTPGPVARQIKSFRLKYHQVVRENKTLGAAAFAAIKSQSDPLINKDRLVLDASPFDQLGVEIGPGQWTPELEAKMFFSDGSQRIRWYGHNSDIGRITMSHPLGLMPRFKIDADLPDNVDIPTGDIYGLYYTTGAAPEDDEPDFSRPHIKIGPIAGLRVRR